MRNHGTTGRSSVWDIVAGSRRGVVALVAAMVALVGAVVGITTATSAATTTCSVRYQVLNQWPGGFQGSVEITNTGAATDGWTLRFDMPDGQTIDQGWMGRFSQSGATVTIESRTWNAALAPGQSVKPGFVGRHGGTTGVPTGFTLNGETCDSGTPPPTTVAPTTVPPDTVPAPSTTTPSTTAPSTTAPSTTTTAASSSTSVDAPTTTERPGTTQPPTTAPPTTAPSTTAPPTTQRPTTAPPTSAPSTTAAPPVTAPPTVPPTTPNPGGRFFVDPNSSAANWVAANRSDSRAGVIAERIAAKPIARWFGDWNANIEADVRAHVRQATRAGAIPVMVAYNIPDRDCGQHSAGGAADFNQYRSWIGGFADGLGDGPAYIVLEPDALALNGCAGSGRNAALADAVSVIKRECGGCLVYLDAGHSNWIGAADMAGRLKDAGVLKADGLASNVSNYNTTGSERAYGQAVLRALGNPAGLGQVIDTSRNGNGPAGGGQWCDPAGRAIGADPTTNTGYTTVHALLWIKVPGEADGCIAGAGQFVPDRAYQLATD